MSTRPIMLMPPRVEMSRGEACWSKWEHRYHPDPTIRIRQVGMIRFDRADGLDPRVNPLEGGTHLSRGRPGTLNDDDNNKLLTSCGRSGFGFSDYGPIEGVDCPDCAAALAAQLLKEEQDG